MTAFLGAIGRAMWAIRAYGPDSPHYRNARRVLRREAWLIASQPMTKAVSARPKSIGIRAGDHDRNRDQEQLKGALLETLRFYQRPMTTVELGRILGESPTRIGRTCSHYYNTFKQRDIASPGKKGYVSEVWLFAGLEVAA